MMYKTCQLRKGTFEKRKCNDPDLQQSSCASNFKWSAFLLLMRCCQDQKVVSTNRLWQKQQTPLTIYGADPSQSLCYLCKKRQQLLKRQWHSNFNVIVDNGRLCIVGVRPCRCFTLSSECNHYLCLVIVFHFAHKKL